MLRLLPFVETCLTLMYFYTPPCSLHPSRNRAWESGKPMQFVHVVFPVFIFTGRHTHSHSTTLSFSSMCWQYAQRLKSFAANGGASEYGFLRIPAQSLLSVRFLRLAFAVHLLQDPPLPHFPPHNLSFVSQTFALVCACSMYY